MKITRTVVLFISLLLAHSASASLFARNNLNTRINTVQATLSQDEEQQNHLQQQLQTIETTRGQLNQEIKSINQACANERFLLSKLMRAKDRTQNELTKQQKILGEHIRNAYLLGQPNELKIMFNQENPSTLNRQLFYYHTLMQNHLKLELAVKQSLSALSTTLQTITQHQQILQKLLTDKNTQQQKLLALETERRDLISHLNQKIATETHELDALLLKLKSEPLALSFANLQGKLAWPTMGAPSTLSGSKAIFIKTAEGTPVHAIAPGKVIFANWLRGFGLLIIIDHGNGYMSLYARNQSLAKQTGDVVQSGETIAASGNSGGFRTAGLYFEIRQNGQPLNPNLWCG